MRAILAIAFTAAAVIAGGTAYAATDLAPPAPTQPAAAASSEVAPAPDSSSRLTKADAEAWLDGFMSYALPRGDIAGAVVAIVKDGQVLLKKGYGYADVAAHKPVDPDLTLFRPGSVSKLFTWTAVMQLVEQGKLDLDADVNKYIDFKIPDRDGKPVTLRNIMTHTAGFEEQAKGIMSTENRRIPALDAHLKRWTPNRIFAAGLDACVFELRDRARRLHRGARLRHVVRRLPGCAHLRAARHEALELSPAAAGEAEAADVQGLSAGLAAGKAL